VPVDCGAIAPSLIESELFGHVAGAFTDARTASPGLLRSAAGGTAFLDEIGELPTAVQVKLLRALQEMEVRPVGGAQAEPLKARIVAATNRDLNKAVALGQFRRDLFYRLHVIPIFVPPLRERREDVPLLVEHFARQCGEQAGRHISITPDALEDLMKQDWPGNVRELENLIARAFALLDGDTITRADLATLSPPRSADYSSAVASHAGAKADQPETGASLCGADYQSAKTVGGEPATPAPAEPVQGRLFDQCAAEAIRHALQEAGGNKRKAARVLGIGIATLYRKMKKYRIPG
jgi:two-component system response regulator HydG